MQQWYMYVSMYNLTWSLVDWAQNKLNKRLNTAQAVRGEKAIMSFYSIQGALHGLNKQETTHPQVIGIDVSAEEVVFVHGFKADSAVWVWNTRVRCLS